MGKIQHSVMHSGASKQGNRLRLEAAARKETGEAAEPMFSMILDAYGGLYTRKTSLGECLVHLKGGSEKKIRYIEGAQQMHMNFKEEKNY